MPSDPQLPGSNLQAHTQARRYFDSVLISHGAKPEVANRIRNRLEDRYRERGRHYHDLSHVAGMMELAVEHQDHLVDFEVVALAIWYHDAIYRSRRQTNEEESAHLALEELTTLVPQPIVKAVATLVLETKKHQPSGLLTDSEPFLDFDLAILGSAEPIYDLYSKAIRSEYRWVPARVYRNKRAEVLRIFLDRSEIYLTKILRAKWEGSARANLTRELAGLAR